MADSKENIKGSLDLQEGEISNSGGFQNVLNFRDVGRTVNDFTGEQLVKEGILFRSARPDDATMPDRERLLDEFKINTIIDLRTLTEHANQKKKREGQLLLPQEVISNKALLEPFAIPGIKYRMININGKSFERCLIKRLSWWSLIKMAFLMLFRQRMKAISIMGREVMQPRGLIGLGKDTLDNCGAELADALRTISSPTNQPVLVHCTQGKDRTGMIICLCLLLLQVPIKAIAFDYLMSEEELVIEKESRLKEIASIGLGEDFAGCPKEWVEEMITHLDEGYGGIEKYVRSIGVTEGELKGIVEGLGV